MIDLEVTAQDNNKDGYTFTDLRSRLEGVAVQPLWIQQKNWFDMSEPRDNRIGLLSTNTE